MNLMIDCSYLAALLTKRNTGRTVRAVILLLKQYTSGQLDNAATKLLNASKETMLTVR